MSARTVTHNKAIHIVEKSMTVDQLIMIMYNSPTQIVYDHFKMVNSHLKKQYGTSWTNCFVISS
ncbi:hypothetical protein [Psychromonas antarctica]|uniref:hypothetical protein n=1 Tax=Psychromonas antarctica TaxID=67573 RepID=UPI001EE7DE5E|nr:hypothetical protein [Psychromonas antarctica]MCG6202920.1 hypothetical protein [Psychromonas antarctica]